MVLARTGFKDGTQPLFHSTDELWLNIASLVSYAFILPIFIITHLLGDIVPVLMVSVKIDSVEFFPISLSRAMYHDSLICHICFHFAGNDVSIPGIRSIRDKWEFSS